MNKSISSSILFIALTSCYTIPSIEGFDEKNWRTIDLLTCGESKVSQAELLVANAGQLLGEGQAEIKQLLGPPDEHELYRRNQKFFYYDLTPASNCPEVDTKLRLSIRFDALDRVKELLIIEDQKVTRE